MPVLNLLRDLLQRVPDRLEKLSQDTVESKPTPSNWSPKEELGHLLDSAANNHQRIVRAQFEDNPAMPGYEQNRWVAVHAYQRRDWKELIEVWQALNRQLLAAAEGGARLRLVTNADGRRFRTVDAAVRVRRLCRSHVAPPAAHRNRNRRHQIKASSAA